MSEHLTPNIAARGVASSREDEKNSEVPNPAPLSTDNNPVTSAPRKRVKKKLNPKQRFEVGKAHLDSLEPATRNILATFDSNGDGIIDLEELRHAAEVYKIHRSTKPYFPTQSFPESLQPILKIFDSNQDGTVSADELTQAALLFSQQRKRTRLYRNMLIVVSFAALLIVGAVVGLTAAVVELSKESHVQGGALVSSTSNEVVRTGSAEFRVESNAIMMAETSADFNATRVPRALATSQALQQHPLTSNLPDSYFSELRFLTLTAPTGATLSLTINGIMRLPDPTSQCGTILTIFTAAGALEIDGTTVSFRESSLEEAFVVAGFNVQGGGSRRRLSGLVALEGMFNAIEDYDFDCPLVQTPTLPTTMFAKTHEYIPCEQDATAKALGFPPPPSLCELKTTSSIKHIVTNNGRRYLYTTGYMARSPGVAVSIAPDFRDDGKVKVTVVKDEEVLRYDLKDGVVLDCNTQESDEASLMALMDPASLSFSYLSREFVGDVETDHFLLTGEMPDMVVQKFENLTSGTLPEVLGLHYYETVEDRIPARIVDIMGSITDFTDMEHHPDRVQDIINAFSTPECGVGATNDLMLEFSILHDLDAPDFSHLANISRIFDVMRAGVEPHITTAESKNNFTIGDALLRRWVVEDGDGEELCVFAHRASGNWELALERCILGRFRQDFSRWGLYIRHEESGLCVARVPGSVDLTLRSCDSIWVPSFFQNSGTGEIGVIGGNLCIAPDAFQDDSPLKLSTDCSLRTSVTLLSIRRLFAGGPYIPTDTSRRLARKPSPTLMKQTGVGAKAREAMPDFFNMQRGRYDILDLELAEGVTMEDIRESERNGELPDGYNADEIEQILDTARKQRKLFISSNDWTVYCATKGGLGFSIKFFAMCIAPNPNDIPTVIAEASGTLCADSTFTIVPICPSVGVFVSAAIGGSIGPNDNGDGGAYSMYIEFKGGAAISVIEITIASLKLQIEAFKVDSVYALHSLGVPHLHTYTTSSQLSDPVQFAINKYNWGGAGYDVREENGGYTYYFAPVYPHEWAIKGTATLSVTAVQAVVTYTTVTGVQYHDVTLCFNYYEAWKTFWGDWKEFGCMELY